MQTLSHRSDYDMILPSFIIQKPRNVSDSYGGNFRSISINQAVP